MNNNITYRKAELFEWDEAMDLAWETFSRFDAPDYSDEGIKNFKDFVSDEKLHQMFIMGAYELFVAIDNIEDIIVGVISLRNKNHISLLFVDKNYHRQGIGRKLVELLCEYKATQNDCDYITVNSSPYAVGFYHKIGFIDKGLQTMADGIIYTPMEILI